MKTTYQIAVKQGCKIQFKDVEGEPITINGLDTLDLFIHKTTTTDKSTQDKWRVSEGKTGLNIVSGKTKKQTIINASKRLSGKTTSEMIKLIDSAIEFIGMPTPRHRVQKC